MKNEIVIRPKPSQYQQNKNKQINVSNIFIFFDAEHVATNALAFKIEY